MNAKARSGKAAPNAAKTEAGKTEATSPLVARIAERLKALGISEREASKRVGKNMTLFRDFRRNNVTELLEDRYPQVARALETSVAYLKFETDDPSPGAVVAAPLHPAPDGATTAFAGSVSDEPMDAATAQGPANPAAVAPDQRYPASAQRLYYVRNNRPSAAPNIAPSAWIVAVNLDEALSVHGPLRPGDLVVIEQLGGTKDSVYRRICRVKDQDGQVLCSGKDEFSTRDKKVNILGLIVTSVERY